MPRKDRRSGGLTRGAEEFCLHYCRQPDDTCPFGWTRARCPLWQFVEADLELGETPAPIPETVEYRACLVRARRDGGRPFSAARITEANFDPEEGFDWPA